MLDMSTLVVLEEDSMSAVTAGHGCRYVLYMQGGSCAGLESCLIA